MTYDTQRFLANLFAVGLFAIWLTAHTPGWLKIVAFAATGLAWTYVRLNINWRETHAAIQQYREFIKEVNPYEDPHSPLS